MKFDLEERTTKFSEEILEFAKQIPQNVVTNPLISQLVRSATSIGANYCEADDAFTKKDFTYKISLCKKEARETVYWLKLMEKAMQTSNDKLLSLSKEAKELHLIFVSIVRSSKRKK